ncbi:MAG: hypothetical protein AAF389_04715 [Gemmatimonadota bacterium]
MTAVVVAGHEFAHLLAARLVGAPATFLSSVGVVGDWSGLDDGGAIVVGASGSLSNVLLALVGWLLLRVRAGRPTLVTVAGWLLVYLSLWPVVGYAVLSPIVGPDDWMIVLDRFPNRGALRATIIVTGLFAAGVVWRAMSEKLALTIGNGLAADRRRRARQLVWTAWFAGTALVTFSAVVGAHEPWTRGAIAIAIFALSTIPILVAAEEVGRIPVPGEALPGERSVPALVLGMLCGIAFVALLGPGITFGG